MAKCVVEDCEADVNASTYSGCSALHMAASQGHIDQVAYLIAMGADPFSRTDEGDLPIDYATEPLVSIEKDPTIALMLFCGLMMKLVDFQFSLHYRLLTYWRE